MNKFPELKDRIAPISEANLLDLFNSLSKNQISAFVGAGLSYETGIPTWRGLLEALANQCQDFEIPNNPINEPELASLIKDKFERDGNNFYEAIRTIISNRNLPTLTIHEDLLSNIIKFCITTNFDDVFDKAIELRNIQCSSPQFFPRFNISNILNDKLCYLHGNVFNGDNIIFTKESYHNAYDIEEAPVTKFFEAIYMENNILFLGVSLQDLALKNIIENFELHMSQMWESAGPHYIFFPVTHDQLDSESNQYQDIIKKVNLLPIYYFVQKSNTANHSHYNLYYTLEFLFKKTKLITYEI